MGHAGIETSGVPPAGLLVNVANSVITQTGAALRHGHGFAFFASSVVAFNANSLVNCGGVAANVQSLGYGSGVGSNMIYANADPGVPAGCTAYIVPTQFTGK